MKVNATYGKLNDEVTDASVRFIEQLRRELRADYEDFSYCWQCYKVLPMSMMHEFPDDCEDTVLCDACAYRALLRRNKGFGLSIKLAVLEAKVA